MPCLAGALYLEQLLGILRPFDQRIAGADLLAVGHLKVRPGANERGHFVPVVGDHREDATADLVVVDVDHTELVGQNGGTLGRAGFEESTTRGRPWAMSSPTTPPVWKVRMVNWVPGLTDGLGRDDADRLTELDHDARGLSLATGIMIELGEAVGVIAAQSIGEPGTQLTMRTFHTGGVVGEDITHGLPRVVELFEARTPKGAAVLAHHSGVVRIDDDEIGLHVTVIADNGDEVSTLVAPRAHLEVTDGQEVGAGDALVEGPKDPKELLEVKGIRETQQYLVEEVQKVYRDQGVSIHDKHIELIVRQMLRRVLVAEPGDAPFLPGDRVDNQIYAEVNRTLVEDGQTPAESRPELMGITKASLATESWLSAASFQETTRVLTEAAIEGKSDQLFGLKENIIIGKLIPAGSGMEHYRNIRLEMPDAEAMPFWALGSATRTPRTWPRGCVT